MDETGTDDVLGSTTGSGRPGPPALGERAVSSWTRRGPVQALKPVLDVVLTRARPRGAAGRRVGPAPGDPAPVWSARMAGPMTSGPANGPMQGSMAASMSLTAFVVGWVAMMSAIMFPAVVPVVRLYARAAQARTVAPAPLFVAGYLLVWGAAGVPVWWAWRALAEPVAAGSRPAATAAGAALLLAGAYQLSPVKASCLRHCRSPVGFFLQLRGDLRSPGVAVRAGAAHGLLCLGCCWALMAVLVAVGTMHLGWMLGLTALVLVEKVSVRGVVVGRAVAVALTAAGAVLLARPGLIT